jgi:hypothetical protein
MDEEIKQLESHAKEANDWWLRHRPKLDSQPVDHYDMSPFASSYIADSILPLLRNVSTTDIRLYDIPSPYTGFPRIQLYLITPVSKRNLNLFIRVLYTSISFLRRYQGQIPETLRLHWAPFNKRKTLPTRPMIIGPEHVNSAFTYVSSPTRDIYLYRLEEIDKILIHELIHAFHIDRFYWSAESNATLHHLLREVGYKVVPVHEEFLDTITDTLAIPIHMALLHARMSKPQPCKLSKALAMQRSWCLYQASKVLQYADFTKKEDLKLRTYPQETHVLAYYVFKAALLYQSPVWNAATTSTAAIAATALFHAFHDAGFQDRLFSYETKPQGNASAFHKTTRMCLLTSFV